ncbi:MAG: 4-hydroxyphenylpyruvate dioxygenase [Acidobacteria bacterium]|nr:4-hydroxyphenylpyruvate dioxygenase [Acidobacteriota bacterium]MBI3423199.1 4-hydroxyphenylpyruvate dioxygenase [Acidobacteriota bacterium]
MSEKNPLKIRQVHHIEMYVGNAKQADYYYRNAFGFDRVAYTGLETGNREQCSYALQQGTFRLLLTTPYTPRDASSLHILKHGDGVRDIAFEVDDADFAFEQAVARGAEPAVAPYSIKSERGEARRAAVKIYGDTIHSFFAKRNYDGPFMPDFVPSQAPGRNAGLLRLDHYVANVQMGQMTVWEEWYKRVLGLERFMTFDDKDIATDYTALQSIVMANESRSIKFPINEPAPGKRKSQVEEYNDFYQAAGVQHIALLTTDIIATIRQLRANGVEFLEVPDTYYELLKDRIGAIDEDISVLRELKILVDRDDQGYLLQLFTKPVEDRPTLFFEIIQRKGAQGFGKGNFKALFEAIEREQALRGNLI